MPYSKRHSFSSNQIGQYNATDRRLDARHSPQANITPVIGRYSSPPCDTMPDSQANPLRSRLNRGIRLTVTANGHVVGRALCSKTLSTLVEAGYIRANSVTIEGRIEGLPVQAEVRQSDYHEFRRAIAV